MNNMTSVKKSPDILQSEKFAVPHYRNTSRDKSYASNRSKGAKPKKNASSRNRSRSQSVDPNRNQNQRIKHKQIQTKRANDRLARLEKMYQELTEIENQTAV